MDLADLTLVELVQALRSGEATPAQAVAHHLGRIAERDDLGAFVDVTAESALARAEALGPIPKDPPPLWGVPLADKDLVAREGVPTRYGSRAFDDFVPEASDPLALALDGLGAVSLGKTSTPEFGLTGYTEPAAGEPCRNPWEPATGAGGSSGGAAVAVATGMLPAAVASDGGGSIRIPAATVGVVGLKPSRGRLPIANGLESPGGLSTAGPIARTVEDAAHLLDALVGSVPHRNATAAPDPWARPHMITPIRRGAFEEGAGPMRVGAFLGAVRREVGPLRIGTTLVTPWDGWVDTALHPGARRAYDAAIRVLESADHRIEDADWHPSGYPELFTTIWRASAAGIPVADDDLDRVEPYTAWLIREGRRMGAAEALGAYRAAAAFERDTITAFERFDVVVTPALAMAPQQIGWFGEAASPLENFARQCQYAPHTSFVNVSGLPAITVPMSAAAGERPWSVQLVGRPGGEARILQVAAQLEAARGALPWPSSDG
ncbi:MAG: amidase [Candidatus Microbacterium stercoravium]